MIDICMYGCRGCNFACKYCMGPEKVDSDEEFVLDGQRLYESITFYRNRAKKNSAGFVIWGGEPLLHFRELSQTVSFLNDRFPNEQIMVSTNGFLLKSEKIRKFIEEKNIKIQLSVDGVAQKIRSNFNPLEDETVSSFLAGLANKNLLTINCTMHDKNYSVNANIDYFAEWMKDSECLESKLNIRLTPFNESSLTPEFNFSEKKLSIFINEFEQLYIKSLFGKANGLILRHFAKYPLKAVKKSNFQKVGWAEFNPCSKFYSGQTDFSKHIDTKGNFVSCNLVDSGIPPRGKSVKEIPEYCESCKYRSMRGCWPCPAGDFAEKCEWKFAWMQFQERMLLLSKILEHRNLWQL